MKFNTFFLIAMVLWALPVFSKGASSIIPEKLKCEYRTNPTGLDEPSPRFSWVLSATNEKAYGQKQTAYRILVSLSKKDLNANKGNIWDSEWVSSSKMQLIEFRGKALLSDRNYYWKVCVKDEKGNISQYSQVNQWSTGLFSPQEWTAKWIGTSQILDPSKDDCNIDDPWLRRTFNLKVKPAKATIFVASVGYHELYVNGKKITDQVLAPAVTDHTKRARYIAYDIANELKPGKNVIALWLGTSWSIFPQYATVDKPRTPIVLAQADIYDNGGKKVLRIQTDDSWRTHSSPNKLLGTWTSNNYGGEIYDANKEINDWNDINFNDNNWDKAVVYSPKLKISAQTTEPNRLFNEIHPIAIEERPDGSYRVDMGVNFAGWTQISVQGNPGDRVDFLFSEREKEDMTFKNHSAYIIGPSGKGTFHNRFNYSSGRWITIKGLKTKPQLEDIKGWLVRTNYKSTTTFTCSDSLQNWIYDRIRWTYENLSIGGYIVDCPQRERLGYGGDAHGTFETGLLNYDLGAFYTKWMEDWRDVQDTKENLSFLTDPNWKPKTENIDSWTFINGNLPNSAPTYCGGGGTSYGGIVVTLPWVLYKQEGDTRVLKKNFEMIKGWLSFLDTHTKDDLLQRYGGVWDFLGDWLWPHATAEGMNNNKPETVCLNNCYRVFNLRTAAKIARVIGKTADAEKWEQQAEASSRAINAKFYDAADHSYCDKSMSNLAAALLGEVPPPELRNVVMKRLEKDILEVHNGHINVGITAGAMLFMVLRDAGRDDLAYSMLSQTTYPGWGVMKAEGATTIREMWEKDLPGHSLLHSSYLYPGAWYVEGVAGIRCDVKTPGYRKFIVRMPKLTESQISSAKATFDSPAGRIKTDWKRQDGHLMLSLTVPPNCGATVYVPSENNQEIIESSGYAKKIGTKDGYVLFEVPAGKYEFKN